MPLMSPAVIIIPVYNHCHQIHAVIQRAKRLHLPIIVVDDGSTDATPFVLQRISGIALLRHPVNRGKGAAILTGMQAAANLTHAAITMDADGQHEPAAAVKLLRAAARQPQPTIVVGARMGMRERNVPESSRIGRRFSNFWVRCAGGPRLSDSQSGFRLYPLPQTLQLDVRSRRFQFEIEVLVKAHWHGLPIIETAVPVYYQSPNQRISHFDPWKDSWRNGRVFSRLIFRLITQSPLGCRLSTDENR